MAFFEVYLVRKSEEQVAGLDLMADEVNPVTIAAFLYQEEEVIILSMG